LTNPACISADAGVGAVIEANSHVWNGTSADWIIAANSSAAAAISHSVCGIVSAAAAIPETVVAPVADHSTASATTSSPPLARKYRRASAAAACACGHPLTWPISSAINRPIATHASANSTMWSAATSTETTSVKPKTVAKNRSTRSWAARYRRE
jgi:hypothetical protein